MDWFEEWFDSPLYEKLYADRDEDEAARLIDLLERVLSLPAGSKILDLGCGRGRHAITLSQKGYQVTGIDLSEQAIATAREKSGHMGIEQIRFEVRDMRNPLPETFDAVFNLFTTFGYFESDEENAGVFDSVSQMLSPGGIFVVDYFNAQKVRSTIRPHEEGSFHGIHYDISRYIENDMVFKEITFSGDEVNDTKKYVERVKLYEKSWFEREMSKRNFSIDHVYGDYLGNDFDPDVSSRLLLVSHRQK
ncbi:SAM-dependent methyltransferase [Fodinibius sediminis]|uniref:Methyltransferase domain-containing protein n=1 Tax=Fodinibius sediminis TaxID=1214077 RepID=A0A521D673_9BACT|nr:class I SAM-dependent methyltransferase [Fodinibius sediminis]SMO66370.1 Methyltransferase domain-containing protein [Fodinibius sediminis]